MRNDRPFLAFPTMEYRRPALEALTLAFLVSRLFLLVATCQISASYLRVTALDYEPLQPRSDTLRQVAFLCVDDACQNHENRENASYARGRGSRDETTWTRRTHRARWTLVPGRWILSDLFCRVFTPRVFLFAYNDTFLNTCLRVWRCCQRLGCWFSEMFAVPGRRCPDSSTYVLFVVLSAVRQLDEDVSRMFKVICQLHCWPQTLLAHQLMFR